MMCMANPQQNQHTNISYCHILAIALPVLLANIAIPLQNLIDTAVVGHFAHADFLAAVGVSSQLLSLLLVSFNFLQYASSGLSSQALGGSRWHELSTILQRGLLLAGLIALGLFCLKKTITNFGLMLFAANETTNQLASHYLYTRFYGVFAELMNYALLGWFAGQGKTKLVLYQQLLIALVNMSLTLWFSYGLHLGLMGVALATVIAHYAGLVLAIWLAQQQLRSVQQSLWHMRTDDLNLTAFNGLLRLNGNIFVRTFILTLSFSWVTRLSSLVDTGTNNLTLAANSLLLQTLSISAFALDGVAVAAESLAGQTIASGKPALFFQAVKRTGVVSYLLAVLLSGVWLLIMPWYLTLMTDIASIKTLAQQYAGFAIALPVVSVGAYWLDGIFFGLTLGRQIRQAALVLALIFFPTSYVLYHGLANTGIWLSIYVMMLVRLLVLAYFLQKKLYK